MSINSDCEREREAVALGGTHKARCWRYDA